MKETEIRICVGQEPASDSELAYSCPPFHYLHVLQVSNEIFGDWDGTDREDKLEGIDFACD